ncbi:hypothetical protein NDU88_006518 [Pleurodeles waltl]|uniref:Uncharacterized protein n=1 Tax=Pleurodeles waltl TaxID=8319 RepID=A0AAV7WXT4_PLEWA|nr:hypothetical protein NDU88_006518 [Pleurodeles waltl]
MVAQIQQERSCVLMHTAQVLQFLSTHPRFSLCSIQVLLLNLVRFPRPSRRYLASSIKRIVDKHVDDGVNDVVDRVAGALFIGGVAVVDELEDTFIVDGFRNEATVHEVVIGKMQMKKRWLPSALTTMA